MRHLLLLAAITTLVLGCKKDAEVDTMNPMPTTHKIVFESEYINHAWGYMHHGWLIDSAGNIFTYEKLINWNFPDSTGTLNVEEVEANLAKAKLSATKIDKQVLKEKINLIVKASQGVITPPENAMYDAGTRSFYAYIYKHGKYTRVLLKQQGDWESANKSAEGEALYAWLSSIDIN